MCGVRKSMAIQSKHFAFQFQCQHTFIEPKQIMTKIITNMNYDTKSISHNEIFSP